MIYVFCVLHFQSRKSRQKSAISQNKQQMSNFGNECTQSYLQHTKRFRLLAVLFCKFRQFFWFFAWVEFCIDLVFIQYDKKLLTFFNREKTSLQRLTWCMILKYVAQGCSQLCKASHLVDWKVFLWLEVGTLNYIARTRSLLIYSRDRYPICEHVIICPLPIVRVRGLQFFILNFPYLVSIFTMARCQFSQ